MRLHHLRPAPAHDAGSTCPLTVNLGAGTIRHVVDDTGAQVDTSAIGIPAYVVDYP